MQDVVPHRRMGCASGRCRIVDSRGRIPVETRALTVFALWPTFFLALLGHSAPNSQPVCTFGILPDDAVHDSPSSLMIHLQACCPVLLCLYSLLQCASPSLHTSFPPEATSINISRLPSGLRFVPPTPSKPGSEMLRDLSLLKGTKQESAETTRSQPNFPSDHRNTILMFGFSTYYCNAW